MGKLVKTGKKKLEVVSRQLSDCLTAESCELTAKYAAHMPKTYTVKEVAQILGYSTNSIYSFLKEKRIKGVRVGRGRFRIPEGELNRLLGGRPKEGPSLTATVPSPSGGNLLPPSLVRSPLNTLVDHHSLHVPSLFDWFVAAAAVVVGLSLFLYSQSFDTVNLSPFLVWLWPVRLGMLLGGAGLLFCEFWGKDGRLWARLFLITLALCFAWLAALLWQSQNMGGVFLYGLLAAVIFGHLVLGLKELLSLLIYGGLLALVTPIMALFFPGSLWLPPTFPLYQAQPVVFSLVWIAVIGLAFGVALWSFQRQKLVLSALLGMVVCLELTVAYWFAQEAHWARAFFMLVVALTTLLVLEWGQVRFAAHQRRVTVTLLTGLLTLLVLAISLIWVIQRNSLQYSEKQMVTKVGYGRLTLETLVHQVTDSVEGLAQNPLLIETLEKADPKLLAGLIRSVYEGNRYLYRVLVFAKNGDVLAYYPLSNPLAIGNVAFRDYFTQAVSTRQTVISDLFEAKTEARQPAIMVATPVFDKKRQVVGVIGGSLNLRLLGERLQQLAAAEFGEQLVVVDKSGKRMIHPESSHMFTTVEGDNLLQRALAGERGAAYAFEVHGPRMLQAYEAIPSLGWGVMVEAPVASLIQANQVAFLVIAGLTAVSAVVLAVFFAAYRLPSVGL